jgi:hypothetical protein
MRLGRRGYKACGRRTDNPSIDARLGYVLLSIGRVVLSNGPLDIDLNDPVNSDGGRGKTSLLALGTGGLLGGDEASGSRVILAVSKSAPGLLFRLVALPDVVGRGLVARGKSGCWSVAGTPPLPPRFCTHGGIVGVNSISSVPSRGGPLIENSSPEMEIPDSKSAVSPDKTDPIEVNPSLSGPSFPAPGSLVRATLMVTVMSKSRVPIGLIGNHRASLIGSV